MWLTDMYIIVTNMDWCDSISDHKRLWWSQSVDLLTVDKGIYLLGGELPTNRKWVSSPQWFQWINPTKIPCKSLGWTYPLTIRGMFATKWYLHLLWFVQIRSPECQVLKGPPWAVPLDLIVTSDSLRKFEGSHRARSGNSAEFSPARPVALLVPMLENHVM